MINKDFKIKMTFTTMRNKTNRIPDYLKQLLKIKISDCVYDTINATIGGFHQWKKK